MIYLQGTKLINTNLAQWTKKQTHVTIGHVGGGICNSDEHHQMNHSGMQRKVNSKLHKENTQPMSKAMQNRWKPLFGVRTQETFKPAMSAHSVIIISVLWITFTLHMLLTKTIRHWFIYRKQTPFHSHTNELCKSIHCSWTCSHPAAECCKSVSLFYRGFYVVD